MRKQERNKAKILLNEKKKLFNEPKKGLKQWQHDGKLW